MIGTWVFFLFFFPMPLHGKIKCWLLSVLSLQFVLKFYWFIKLESLEIAYLTPAAAGPKIPS